MAEVSPNFPPLLPRVLRADQSLLDDGEHRFDLRSGAIILLTIGILIGMALGASQMTSAVQVFYASIKVPLLLVGAGALTLPFLGILLAVGGHLDHFPRIIKMVAVAEIGFASAIASLAPIVLLQAWAGADYATTRVLWLVAFGFGLGFAFAQLRKLLSGPAMRIRGIWKVLVAWLVVHALATLQLAWTLRPFLGRPGSEIEFIRSGPLQNAYIEIWNLVIKQFLQ